MLFSIAFQNSFIILRVVLSADYIEKKSNQFSSRLIFRAKRAEK
jgi:hypothetical protein